MLQGFWFGVIAVLWAGFFVLEGFDFGVGMLLPFVGKDEKDREVALRAIGPVWDGNEVWLLTAGGATFAAFPEWYASVFSGFYLAFALLLVGLIIRGIGIEYRGKAQTAQGRRWCDAGVVVGSLLPALLLGVAFANFVRGVKLDSRHVMTGGFFDLLSPYALLGGLTTLSLFAFHGAVFLGLRVHGPVQVAAGRLARTLAIPAFVFGGAFLFWTMGVRGGWLSKVLAVVIVLALVASIRALLLGRFGWSFSASALVALLVPVWVFACLWPNVLPASNGSKFSLTVHAASSSHYTLSVMTVVALIFTPIVLAYQAWTYWVFRARVGVPVPDDGDGLTQRARQAAQHLIEPTTQ
jgi:cytochrome bd ubiquinol oxidase subunit II